MIARRRSGKARDDREHALGRARGKLVPRAVVGDEDLAARNTREDRGRDAVYPLGQRRTTKPKRLS